jgi:penicillin-binding protein 2
MFGDGDHNGRRVLFLWIIGAVFTVFFGRLVQLQVLYQDEYGKKSEENSIRPIAHDPIRGYIFDRHGTLIVDNRPSYTVSVTPSEFHESEIPALAAILGLDTAFIRDRINKGRVYNRFAPTKVKRDIDFKTLSLLEESRGTLPGVDYQIESKRYYPTKAKASHLFGYTKEVSDKLVQEDPDQYRPGDLIGATGLEAKYETYLRGQKGFEFITVNARGEMLGAFNEGKSNIAIKEGDDLFLSMDAGVQALAESLLADKRGAVVAIDPTNGGVIALASKPDFDLTSFGGVTPADVWNALNTDPLKPMFNRATMTRYQPGSTYKMLLALAALQEGVIPTTWSVSCTGGFRFGTRVFKDLHVHGYTGMIESIQRSCNVYYYQLMLKTGFERWTQYGREFGFGSPTGIDIAEENSGLLPSEEYYDRVYGKASARASLGSPRSRWPVTRWP